MAKIKKVEYATDYRNARVDSSSMGEYNDCAVVAVTIACNVPYADAHKVLAGLGRKKRRGTYRTDTMAAVQKFGYRARSWSREEMQAVIASYPGTHSKLKGITSHHLRRFPESWKEKAAGTLLLFSSRHVLAVKAGQVMDWSVNSALRITSVWEITKQEV